MKPVFVKTDDLYTFFNAIRIAKIIDVQANTYDVVGVVNISLK